MQFYTSTTSKTLFLLSLLSVVSLGGAFQPIVPRKDMSVVGDYKVEKQIQSSGVVDIDNNVLDNDDLTVEQPSPSALIVSAQPLRKQPSLQTWLRRLSTREDVLGTHKITSLGFVLSSTAILVSGVATGFQEFPVWLQPLDTVFFWSTSACCLLSIPMAINHRRSQPKVRNMFILASVVAVYQLLIAEWYTPWAADIFDSGTATRLAVYGFLLISGLAHLDVELNGREEMLDSINGKKRAMSDNPYLKDIPLLGSLDSEFLMNTMNWMGHCLNLLFVAFLLDPAHDRDWFLEFASRTAGASAYYYYMVLCTCAPMYGSLLVTLRDKQLVEKGALDLYVLATSAIIVSLSCLVLLPKGALSF